MEESERISGVETGGVLVGFVDSRLNAVVVTAASGPGPRAHHGTCTFNRDRAFCQHFLDQHAAATGGVIDFLGEWHKHREPDPQPSAVDQNTYRQLALNSEAKVSRPVVLIAGSKPIGRRPVRDQYIRVNGFIFRSDSFVEREVRWLADEAYADLCVPSNGNPGPP
jgi:integrative and conjugative element protein (TIGR02256 family)